MVALIFLALRLVVALFKSKSRPSDQVIIRWDRRGR
jgi:hypothetical protein